MNNTLKELRKINPHVEIFDIYSKEFKRFGKVSDLDCSEIIDYLIRETEIPQEGNFYTPIDKNMEEFQVFKEAYNKNYGLIDVEIGYCNGQSTHLNGLEYHKTNEFNIGATDMVIFLAMVQDMNGNYIDTKDARAFFLGKGEVVELYQTSMHYAPCKVHVSGFKCGVILSRSTNVLTNIVDIKAEGEHRLLFKQNTWLVVHPDFKEFVDMGAFPGITGENTKINYLMD